MAHLGIDIGGTSVKAAVWRDGACVRTGQSAFYSKPTADHLRRAIVEAAGLVEDLDSVGLCVPGILNDERTAVTLAVNVPGLVGLPLDRLVPQAMGLDDARPTLVSNDAAATAHDIAIARQLHGRLMVLTLGTGVGCAVLEEGVPLVIDGGAPGYFGQIDVSIPGHDVIGPDGGAGGLEGYIGVAALREAYGQDFSAAVEKFDGSEPPISALVRALRIAHAMYRPQHICICGGLGIRMQHLLPVIRQRVDDHLTSVARPDYTLTCGDTDFHAARGAAQLAANLQPHPSQDAWRRMM